MRAAFLCVHPPTHDKCSDALVFEGILMPILSPQRRSSAPQLGQLKLAIEPTRPARTPRAAKHLKTDQYLAQNLDIAGRILANPAAHGGDEAGLVRWARLVADRAAREAAQP
jgi:hypothetical protein